MKSTYVTIGQRFDEAAERLTARTRLFSSGIRALHDFDCPFDLVCTSLDCARIMHGHINLCLGVMDALIVRLFLRFLHVQIGA